MLGMGALLQPRDFALVFRRPKALAFGLSVQWVAAPVLAVAVVTVLALPPGIAAGVVLVAAVPGGTMSNVFTYFGRGNIALSISLTAVTTVASLVTTPLFLRLLAASNLPRDFEMPTGRIAFEISVVLLLPMLLGMGIGARFPQLRNGVSKWAIRISLALIAAMVVGGASAGRLDPHAYGVLGIISIVILCVALSVVAFAGSRLIGLPLPDRLAIGIEATIRNTNLALMVKASLFPAVAGVPDPVGDGMFFVALLYGGVALVVSLGPVYGFRRWIPAVALEGRGSQGVEESRVG